LIVTGITGACGKEKRTGPTLSSCSSSAIGTKSLPSAPESVEDEDGGGGLSPDSASMTSSMRCSFVQRA
jgi:hypothetical protein